MKINKKMYYLRKNSEKGLCSTVQPNMVTQPTFSDAGKAQTRLLYNFLKSLSSINNLRKKLE